MDSKPSDHPVAGMLELEEYQFYDSDHRLGLRGSRAKRRRNRKKAIISSLIRILVDPASPQDSEEESEM